MAKLLAQNRIAIDWSDIDGRITHIKPKGAHIRSTGVHLSGVIKHVLTATGQLKPSDVEDEVPIRMAFGMAWEDLYVGLWPDLVWQPGEWEQDGVFGTPDGITHGTEYPMLEEFKATWKSEYSHRDILRERIWMYQLMGNCYAMNIRFARIHVFWVNGDYRPPAPKCITYLIEFTAKELSDFWRNVVLNNKDSVIPEKH